MCNSIHVLGLTEYQLNPCVQSSFLFVRLKQIDFPSLFINLGMKAFFTLKVRWCQISNCHSIELQYYHYVFTEKWTQFIGRRPYFVIKTNPFVIKTNPICMAQWVQYFHVVTSSCVTSNLESVCTFTLKLDTWWQWPGYKTDLARAEVVFGWKSINKITVTVNVTVIHILWL